MGRGGGGEIGAGPRGGGGAPLGGGAAIRAAAHMLREREAAMAALSQVRLRLCHADGCTQPGTVTFVSRRGCTQPAPRGCIYVTAVLIEVLERRMLPLAVRSPRVLKEVTLSNVTIMLLLCYSYVTLMILLCVCSCWPCGYIFITPPGGFRSGAEHAAVGPCHFRNNAVTLVSRRQAGRASATPPG
eukprot:5458830-Pyramimonas_sp.AAC.1